MNQGIRDQIKASGIKHWQIADALGISEFTLVRWFRYPLTAEQQSRIKEAIKRIKTSREAKT